MAVARHWWIAGPLLVACAAACATAPGCDRLDAAQWLVGSWRAESRDSVVTETWTEVGARTYEGRGETRARADGQLRDQEDLRLVAMGDGVFYVAKVAHNDRPVAFRLTTCGDGRLVFENPSHDFPRRIEYRRLDGIRFEVHVSDGAGRGFRLEFTRQPPAGAAAG
jgi:hypothetical protein